MMLRHFFVMTTALSYLYISMCVCVQLIFILYFKKKIFFLSAKFCPYWNTVKYQRKFSVLLIFHNCVYIYFVSFCKILILYIYKMCSLLLGDAILLLCGSLDPLLVLHETVLQLHCTNLMKGVKYCLYTFQRAVAFYCRRRQQKTRHESTDRNIKWGSRPSIEYKWGYFTLQSCAKQRTDSSLCNKSFPFRQPLLLGHCLILSAIEGRNKLVYMVEEEVAGRRCCGWNAWYHGEGWNTLDLLMIMNLQIEECARRASCGSHIKGQEWREVPSKQ